MIDKFSTIRPEEEQQLEVAVEGDRRGVLVMESDDRRVCRHGHSAQHRRARRIGAIVQRDVQEIGRQQLDVRHRDGDNAVLRGGLILGRDDAHIAVDGDGIGHASAGFQLAGNAVDLKEHVAIFRLYAG